MKHSDHSGQGEDRLNKSVMLPQIDPRFMKEYEYYDKIRNDNFREGKKYRKKADNERIIRKKNHEFFQELNTIVLGELKQKFEVSPVIYKYKNATIQNS